MPPIVIACPADVDLAPAPIVTLRFCLIASRVGERAEFFERPAIKLERIIRGNSFAGKNFLC